jgi:hypothetical protein
MIVVLPVKSGLGSSLDYWMYWVLGWDLVGWFGLVMAGLLDKMMARLGVCHSRSPESCVST